MSLERLFEEQEFLLQTLEQRRKQGMLDRKTYEELLKRIKNNTKEIKDSTDEFSKASATVREAKKSAKIFAANSLRGVQAIRKNREDFRSLNPAVKATAEAAKLAGSATGKLISGLGDAISTFSIFGGPLVKALGAVGGGALNVLGTAMDENAKLASSLGQAFGQFALGELQKVTESYRQIGATGGITARGMTGVYEDARRAGMGLAEYSQLIANQGSNLANFAGGVTAGADALGKVSIENERYKQEYLKLGYTYAEQQKYTGEYLKRNRVLQAVSIDDTNKLAEGSREYLDLLDDVSRLTGLNKDEAAKEIEEQQSNVRFASAQRLATKRSGSTAIANNMSLVSSGIKAFGSKGLAQGFQDLMSGMGTEAGKEFDRAMGGEGQKIADMVKSGEIDANQALAWIHQNAKRMRANVVTDRFLSTAQRTNTVMDNIAEGITNLALSEELTVEKLAQLRAQQKKAREAKDKETQSITNAQAAMRKMAMDFDEIVQKQVFPLATVAVDKFTDLVVEFVNKAGSTLGFVNKVVRKVRGQPEPVEKTGPGVMAPPGEGLTGKALTGITPTLAGRIEQVAREYKGQTGRDVNVTSTLRTREEQVKLYNDYISGKSRYPAAPPGTSKHEKGQAIDVDSRVANELDKMGLLSKYGLGRPVKNDPVHIEVVSLAEGGIASGPKSGYPAVLHGIEAVIPLSDPQEVVDRALVLLDTFGQQSNNLKNSSFNNGRTISGPKSSFPSVGSNQGAAVPLPNGQDIPIQETIMADSTEQQIKTIRRQNQIIAEIISAARSNNDANKRLLSLKAS